MTTEIALPSDYPALLERLKAEISSDRIRATLKVNKELIRLYWRIGSEILLRESEEGWGARVIDRLAVYLKQSFPEMKGLSRTNLKYMRAFAAAWSLEAIGQQAVDQLPWGHNVALLYKISDPDARLWYARNALEYGWTRNVLEHHIATSRHEREGKALNNFTDTLPSDQSELVEQIAHDPYNLEFLDITQEAKERDLEKALLSDVQRFMLELGSGFAFVGSQVPIDVEGDIFQIDLLFFHIPLNRYVVMDLKIGKFRPANAGQINFYVNLVNDKIRLDHHEPTIGLVLCASKNERVVQYALDGLTRPVGVAGYKTSDALVEHVPAQLEDQLPEASELEAGLERITRAHADEIQAAEQDEEH